MLIAPKRNIVVGGQRVTVDGQLAGTPSCLFDAVAIIVTEKSGKALALDSSAIQFVQDAFGHLKAIGTSPRAQSLLLRAGVAQDPGTTAIDGEFDAFLMAAAERQWDRETSVRMLA